jgi:L,D-peptidoglycan transpeptidase YkuD (ErfK/YbiS/YcfS/YnhG family)
LVEFAFEHGFVIGPGLKFPAVCGKAGVTAQKREGDAATPAGRLALRRVLYRADRLSRPPVCAVPVEPISPQDGWCDDVANAAYNQPVRLPFAGRYEALWRDDGIYDVIGVLDWNTAPILRGRGSAIFLHVARPDMAPTAGCIALALAELLACLAAGLTLISVRG